MDSRLTGRLLAIAVATMITLAAHAVEGQARGSAVDRGTRSGGSVEIERMPRPELQRRASNQGDQVPAGECVGRASPDDTGEGCVPATGSAGRSLQESNPRRSAPASFDEAHARFQRELSQRCRDRAEERPLDLEWQVRVRAECRIEHDRWRERHDPAWSQ